jgi:hypothetical protein
VFIRQRHYSTGVISADYVSANVQTSRGNSKQGDNQRNKKLRRPSWGTLACQLLPDSKRQELWKSTTNSTLSVMVHRTVIRIAMLKVS